MMKIRLDQIPDSGLNLIESYEPVSLDLDREDIKLTEPITVSAQITKGINNISVELKINATLHLNCSRCLDKISIPLNKKSNINFTTYGKNEIDLTDSLREEIVLAYPTKPLCQDDCRGLCQVCGQNLNQGKCSCKSKNAHSLRKPLV